MKRKTVPLTSQQRAALDEIKREAQRQGKERFGAKLEAIGADIRALLKGRRLNELSGAETIRFMALRAEFDGLSIEQHRFTEAVAAHLLNPRDGSELVA